MNIVINETKIFIYDSSSFIQLIQSIAVGCPLLEYVHLAVRKVNRGEIDGFYALGELARLRRLRSLFINLQFQPTENDRVNIFEALDKIIEANGNALEVS
jgi:hypothetical protein